MGQITNKIKPNNHQMQKSTPPSNSSSLSRYESVSNGREDSYKAPTHLSRYEPVANGWEDSYKAPTNRRFEEELIVAVGKGEPAAVMTEIDF